MKLAVVGSRDFSDYVLMKEELDKIDFNILVSGGAKGADKMSEIYAFDNDIPMIIHKPDWENLGKKAGYIRNVAIVEECDKLIAFWDGISNGTRHSINIAEKAGKLLKVVRI